MNATIVEQLIAPIIKQYASDGSAVFDSFGGAVLRRLQIPDQILLLSVDTSASMRSSTDFREVNDQQPAIQPELTASKVVEVENHQRAGLDELKDFWGKYEAFRDILAIVAEGDDVQDQRGLASLALSSLRLLLGYEIVQKHEQLLSDREHARSYYACQAISEAEVTLRRLKVNWAGLQTHQESLEDFLIFRANTSSDVNHDWK